ncbi:helix-turn-helix transcriptional regulator [Plantibacter sp. Mn2098]|uniref:helix-turn-helix transcriptional regulator n=1 Tax=Plantibacter sp. Mn2098 TaxID=3395266 RepID=UPI003BD82BC0
MDRMQLADFLRHRRGALRAADVGLKAGPRRRTAGLRREEVAALAGMSTDYYTRLEQARSPQPSEQMLGALARALRLTMDERDHLYRLAGQHAPARHSLDRHVAPALQRVLDRLDDTPALILSSLGETLLQNKLSKTIFGNHSDRTGFDRSAIYRWFTDPAERACYLPDDYAHQSRAQVANLRVAFGIAGTTAQAGKLVHALQRISPEFTELWERHEVVTRFEDHKILRHPEVGEMELDCQALFTEDQSQALLVLTAAPRSESAEKLKHLGVLGREQFSD